MKGTVVNNKTRALAHNYLYNMMKTEDKIVVRAPLPGELGWIVQVHGQYYAMKFGWLEEFEAIVAEIVLEYLKSSQHEAQACFIAELGGKPVGCIMLTNSTGTEGQLRVMFVSEEVRGKGVGTLLINAVLTKSEELGHKSLVLWTTDKQKGARELYKKFGFSMISSTQNETFAKDANNELWRLEMEP